MTPSQRRNSSLPVTSHRKIGTKASPAPAGAGTPVLKPADLCGCSAASSRALNRARRSAQQTASDSAAIQPKRGTACSDHRKRISAGAVPKAILSDSEFELGPEPALSAQQSGDAPIEAVEDAGPDDAGESDLPADHIVGLNRSDRDAHAREAHAQSQRGNGIGDHRAERDPARFPVGRGVVAHWLVPVTGISRPTMPRIVSPAIARWPSSTRGATPAGR